MQKSSNNIVVRERYAFSHSQNHSIRQHAEPKKKEEEEGRLIKRKQRKLEGNQRFFFCHLFNIKVTYIFIFSF